MEQEQLSKKEQDVVGTFLKKTKLPRAKSGRMFVVGMMGLVGAGKSTIAVSLAKDVGAVVVRGDDLRVILRNKNIKFDRVLPIRFAIIEDILGQGSSVVADSDFADAFKRNNLKKVAKDGGAQLRFVRVVCEHDAILGRIVNESFGTSAKDLFAGASSTWKGQKRPAVVKLREMWRRTPHHYTWSMDQGGEWIQKTLPDVFATVDTTSTTTAKKKVKEIARRILRHR